MIIHVMTKQRTLPSGAEEWKCSTCDHREIIGADGARVVIVKGIESAGHGLGEMTWRLREFEKIREASAAGRINVRPNKCL